MLLLPYSYSMIITLIMPWLTIGRMSLVYTQGLWLVVCTSGLQLMWYIDRSARNTVISGIVAIL